MRNLALACACAALAISGGAYAQGKGNGNGNGNGNGPPAAQSAQKNNGNGNRGGGAVQQRGGPDKAMRGNGNGNRGNANAGKADRGNDYARGNGNNGNRGNGNDRIRVGNNGNGNGNGNRAVAVDRGPDRRGNDGIIGTVGEVFGIRDTRRTSLLDGCPPGLAKKRNGCTPPGLAKQRDYDPGFFGYRGLNDGRYYYDDGYLVRLGRDGGIGSYLPLLGGALSIGNVWPSSYQRTAVPSYYEDYWSLGGRDSYRYSDNVLYRVDPETAAITSIAALLTGDDFRIGQPMPRGYDVYNVPPRYRDQYYDTPQANYRYSDGYIYQVDPETRLIASAIELIL